MSLTIVITVILAYKTPISVQQDLLNKNNIIAYLHSDIMQQEPQTKDNTEPIIIQQYSPIPSKESSSHTKNKFYQVMDQVDQYDDKLSQLQDSLASAMLSLAHIKFTNPYALTAFSFKPSPAILRYNPTTAKLQKEKHPKFIFNRIQDFQEASIEQMQQHEQQEQIEQKIQKQINPETEQEDHFERIVCNRFGMMSQLRETTQASKSFQKVLADCLKLAQLKKNVLNKIQEIESNKQ